MIGGFLFNDISIRSVDFSSCDALHWIDDLTINVGILCGLSSLCEIILPNNDLFDDPYPSLG
jgi:hypothetical protein